MSVRQRGSSWEAAFMFEGQRFRRSFKSEIEAKEWHHLTHEQLKAGVDPSEAAGREQTPQTLKALLTVTTSELWSKNRSGEGSEANAKDCLDLLGESTRPAAVTTEKLIGMVKTFRARNLSGATINRKVAAIRKMLRYAAERHWIPTVPFMPAAEREDGARDRYLTPEEEIKVINYFNSIGQAEMADLVIFLLDTGVRLSTALATHKDWVRDGRIDYPASVMKAAKPHSVYCTERVKQLLTRRAFVDGLLFSTLTVDAAEYYWRKMRAVLHYDQDDGFVMHALRHTFCSRLAMAGVPIVVIKELAAHSQIATTMRYAHLSDATRLQAMQTLQKVYPEVQQWQAATPTPQAPSAG